MASREKIVCEGALGEVAYEANQLDALADALGHITERKEWDERARERIRHLSWMLRDGVSAIVETIRKSEAEISALDDDKEAA